MRINQNVLRQKRNLRLLSLIGLALYALGAVAATTELPVAQDLRAEAKQAALRGGPLLVLFSRRDCKYCETVRRDYLKPLLKTSPYRDRVLVRQVNQDSEAPLTDFRGEVTTGARFAASEKIKLVPVVAFYGPEGRLLAEPIVGARIPDFYPGYLDEAIEKSIRTLAGR